MVRFESNAHSEQLIVDVEPISGPISDANEIVTTNMPFFAEVNVVDDGDFSVLERSNVICKFLGVFLRTDSLELEGTVARSFFTRSL